MKIITIYELIGMVKDGKAPKKIKYKDKIYYYIKGYDFNYMYNSSDYSPLDKNKSLFTFSPYKTKDGREYWDGNTAIDFLNDKVEILEEENKIPEKLRLSSHIGGTFESEQEYRNKRDDEITEKINSIISCLKSKGDK